MPIHLSGLTIDRNRFPTRAAYPFNLQVIQETTELSFVPVTFFSGENGSGKSTMLRAVAPG